VDDLSRAHIAVFEKLNEPGAAYFYNLGTGTPNSVREIITAVENVTGLKVPVVEAERRAGDPPALYADSTKAQQELGWKIQHTKIEAIIATAWKWHQSHPEGFGS
jgi:UDP-glucose 4-epimerase